MRIALIAPFGLRAKGTARARALPLGRALAQRGHRVALIIPPYDGPEDSGLVWHDAGVTVVNAQLPPLPAANPLFHLALAWRTYRLARAWRPDVVHVFKPKGPSGLAGMLFVASRWQGKLVVDADDWEGAGGWNDDPRAGYSPLQRRFFAWQERYGLSHASAWTVASECLRERAIGFGADPPRIFHLPNGIEATAMPMAHPDEQPGRPVALLYTRFAGVRVEDAGGIWRRVRQAEPEATLLVVGRGLAGEEDELARGAPGVEVRGWVEPAERSRALAGVQVALAPWADTPPNRARNSAKILEQMAMGLPLVAYGVGELPKTLGEGGVIVPPGDEQCFAEAVVGLLRDAPRARQMGMRARERCLERYTWERLVGVALAAYGR